MTEAEQPVREGGLAHWIVVFVVFGITGGTSSWFSGVLLNDLLGMEGSFWGGPWSYRIVRLLLIPPFYSVFLVVFGTLFGKRDYFRAQVGKMWRRRLPRALADRLFGPIP